MEDIQQELEFGDGPTFGEALERIQSESRTTVEKGRWFENLFMRLARIEPEFEVAEIWRWKDWPDREELTKRDGGDIGIDLVARLQSNTYVAIQCKCYNSDKTIGKAEIDSFLGASQQSVFGHRWIVATCRWGRNAEKAIQNANPSVSQIDFKQYRNIRIGEEDLSRPVRDPMPLQIEAIDDVTRGLANHDRGRLIMACGTGKTFTSLRISERIVDDGGRVLFVAPSIALVAQARREWLEHTVRPLSCIVVCSDHTAGGQDENEDINLTELTCPVSTKPESIAKYLKEKTAEIKTTVVFCTYHSLRRISEAQSTYGAPDFDLAIADEAHRTTGAVAIKKMNKRNVDFRLIHNDEYIGVRKRLYMTATPRIYTRSSKARLEIHGVKIVDMDDHEVYGPELHRLSFKKAVEEDMLSDYRVIVLGLSQRSITAGLRRQLEDISFNSTSRNAPQIPEMVRVLGVSLAVNGLAKGDALETPKRLHRTLAFSNSVARSKWFKDALMNSQVLSATTRRLESGKSMKVIAGHLDASHTALERNIALRNLADAAVGNNCRIVCNVKLFTEGVDIPSLDAVAFLDPRESQVDVVQAVGRVMRQADGKRFGYIVVPVVIEPGVDVVDALELDKEGYSTVGKVLRALQSHDSRLAETPARFLQIYQPKNGPPTKEPENPEEFVFEFEKASETVYAHVAAASGLGKPGLQTAEEIIYIVKRASRIFQDAVLGIPLAKALDLTSEADGGAKGVCTVAALILCNACLMQRRLEELPNMEDVTKLNAVGGSTNPKRTLTDAWNVILMKDYRPIFQPALDVLGALQESKEVNRAIKLLAECANRVADSLSELGYDHSGPLYHRILGTAKSDGAFYTNNLSAIMLARLTLSPDFTDWTDLDAVTNLRIIDPACGTGTLLMACLRTILNRVDEASTNKSYDQNELHRNVVENVICGLDINQHAIQLAACNLTLGAPSVNYRRMNLMAMQHGPQGDGSCKAGSLDLLLDGCENLGYIWQSNLSLSQLQAVQVDKSEEIDFPLRDIDAVIMNAPFTDGRKRSRKFKPEDVKEMQVHEIAIRDQLLTSDLPAGQAVTSNSIRTFFTPLADKICTNRGGVFQDGCQR